MSCGVGYEGGESDGVGRRTGARLCPYGVWFSVIVGTMTENYTLAFGQDYLNASWYLTRIPLPPTGVRTGEGCDRTETRKSL
jgi:hypothetical protein